MLPNGFDWRSRPAAIVAFRTSDGHHLRQIEDWLHTASPTGWRDRGSMWISFECPDDAAEFVKLFDKHIVDGQLASDYPPPPPPPPPVTMPSTVEATLAALEARKKR